jgi:hypothetical protein
VREPSGAGNPGLSHRRRRRRDYFTSRFGDLRLFTLQVLGTSELLGATPEQPTGSPRA